MQTEEYGRLGHRSWAEYLKREAYPWSERQPVDCFGGHREHRDAAVVDSGSVDRQARAKEEGGWDSGVGREDDGGRGMAYTEAMNDHRGHG